MKKTLATILAVVMVFSLATVAFASDPQDNKYYETLNSNSVLNENEAAGTNTATMYSNNSAGEGTYYDAQGAHEVQYGLATNGITGTVVTNNSTIGTNNGTVTTNGENGTVGTNYKEVTTNNGTVKTNDEKGTVGTNNKEVTTNNGTVTTNGENGTVGTNNKEVTTNNGTVKTNGEKGTVGTNNKEVTTNKGEIKENNATVTDNYGEVETNYKGAVITNNYGKVTNKNKGTIDTNCEGGYVRSNKEEIGTNKGTVEYNAGLITSNEGTVTENKDSGHITTNNKEVTINNGEVTTNGENGTVGTNNGTVGTNNKEVTTNNGTVTTNGEKGTVGTNNKEVTTNNGTVTTNGVNGTVETNEGTVGTNEGTVETNNKEVTTNNGTVETNGENGTVGTNNDEVTYNYGTVKTNMDGVSFNYHTVETNIGTVEENCGTVELNTALGKVYNADPETVEDIYVDQIVVETNYGTVFNATFGNDGKLYLGNQTVYSVVYFEDENSGLEEVAENPELLHDQAYAGENAYTLKAVEAADGYRLVGYNLNGDSETIYKAGQQITVTMPSSLRALFEAIQRGEPVAVCYTGVSGDDNGSGSGRTFFIARPAEDILRVYFGEQLLVKDVDYTIEDTEGGVLITFTDAFLNSHTRDSYDVTVWVNGGQYYNLTVTK